LLHIFKLHYRCVQDTSFSHGDRRARSRDRGTSEMLSALSAKLNPGRRPKAEGQQRFALPGWSFRLSRQAEKRAA